MRVIIRQGVNYIDGDGMPRVDVQRGFVGLTKDIRKAHDFKDWKLAEAWLIRKSLTGTVLEAEDVAYEYDKAEDR